MANQLIPYETDRGGAEVVVKIFNDRRRAGRLYYRTKIFKGAPTSSLFVTTLDYQPSPHEALVGQYEPPITVERVLEDIRRALEIHKEQPVQALPPDGVEITKDPNAVALGRKGGAVGGPARAAALKPERRKEIAEKAAQARWASDRQPETEGATAVEDEEQPEETIETPAVPVDFYAQLQAKHEKLEHERQVLFGDIAHLSIRLAEVEEKLKSIDKIRQLAQEVMADED